MKSRYVFILISLLIFVTLVLSACGGGESNTSNPRTSNPATTSSSKTMSSSTAIASGSVTDLLNKGANLGPVKFDMQVIVSDVVTLTATVYQKNKKMRQEMTIGSTKKIMFFDLGNNIMYSYLPSDGTALKSALNKLMLPLGNTTDPSSLLQLNPKIIGAETVDCKACTIITYEVTGFGTYKAWIWNDKGFPLKVDGLTTNGPSTMVYSNVDFSDIPDSTFDLPANATVISSS